MTPFKTDAQVFQQQLKESGIINNLKLNFKFISSNVMYYLKKLSGVLGLNWSKSSVYCMSLKDD